MISIADHLLDIETDLVSGQYNPIIFQSQQDKSNLATVYSEFKWIFNILKINVLGKLNNLIETQEVSFNFETALKQTIQQLSWRIAQKKLFLCIINHIKKQKESPTYAK